MKKLLFILLFIGLIVVGGLAVNAAYDNYIIRWIVGDFSPSVDDFWNNKTEDNTTYFVVEGSSPYPNSSVYFNVTPSDIIDNWYWSVNGVNISNNYDNYSYRFGRGYNYVQVYGTNMLGSTDTIEWRPYVLFEPANTVVGFNTTRYDELMTIIDDSESLPDFLEESTFTYTDIVGDIFFLFLFGILFVMMWIRQESVTIPAVIGIMLGGVLIIMLPPEWHRVAGAFIMLGVVAIIYTIYKSRYT